MSFLESVLGWELGRVVAFSAPQFLSLFCDNLNPSMAEVLDSMAQKWWHQEKAESPHMFNQGTKPVGSTSTVERWWDRFADSEMLALDSEFVFQIVSSPGQKRKCKSILASVGIVDRNLETLYYKTVRRPPASYHVTPKSIELNGITATSLENGDAEFDQVRKEVQKLVGNKLVLTLGGGSDYKALQLPAATNYDCFDLQDHWFKRIRNQHGVFVDEVMSLKTIYGMYFPGDIIQQVGKPHHPVEDARATMRIFRDIYPVVKTRDLQYKANLYPF